MPQFKKVLCPVDFDQNSLLALRVASELAQEWKANLVILHVVAVPSAPAVALPFGKMEATAKARLERLARGNLRLQVPYEIQVRIGDPAIEILLVARKVSADLIVMATHGRKGFRRLVLGTVAEAVVREAPCPVLTIRETDTRPVRSRLRQLKSGVLDGSISL